MCDIIECEDSDWLWGERGSCNNSTGLCECPDGFGGKDTFSFYNDCHVSLDARLYLSVISIALYSLAFCILSAYAVSLVVEIRKLKGKRSMSRFGSKTRMKLGNTDTEKSGSGQGLTNDEAEAEVPAARKNITARKKEVLLCMVLYAVAAAARIPIQAFLLQDRLVDDLTYSTFWGLLTAFAYGMFWWAVWTNIDIYNNSLPNIESVAKLLGVNTIFVRNPNLFRQVYWVSVVVIFIGYIIAWLLISERETVFPTYTTLVTRLIPLTNVIITFIVVTTMLIAVYLQLKVFRAALGLASSKKLNKKPLRVVVKNLRRAVYYAIFSYFTFLPLGAFFLTSGAQRYLYTYVFLEAVTESLTAINAAFIFHREIYSVGEEPDSDVPRSPTIHQL